MLEFMRHRSSGPQCVEGDEYIKLTPALCLEMQNQRNQCNVSCLTLVWSISRSASYSQLDLPLGFINSPSFSLLSALASSTILSMPRSCSVLCSKSACRAKPIEEGGQLTVMQDLYCAKSGSHSSVFAVPRRYSASSH